MTSWHKLKENWAHENIYFISFLFSKTSVRLLLLLGACWWPLEATTNSIEIIYSLYYYLLSCLNVCVNISVTTTCPLTCSCLPNYWLICLPKISSRPSISWLQNSFLLLPHNLIVPTIFFGLNVFVSVDSQKKLKHLTKGSSSKEYDYLWWLGG